MAMVWPLEIWWFMDILISICGYTDIRCYLPDLERGWSSWWLQRRWKEICVHPVWLKVVLERDTACMGYVGREEKTGMDFLVTWLIDAAWHVLCKRQQVTTTCPVCLPGLSSHGQPAEHMHGWEQAGSQTHACLEVEPDSLQEAVSRVCPGAKKRLVASIWGRKVPQLSWHRAELQITALLQVPGIVVPLWVFCLGLRKGKSVSLFDWGVCGGC